MIRRWWRWLLLAAGGLVMGCMGCLAAGSLAGLFGEATRAPPAQRSITEELIGLPTATHPLVMVSPAVVMATDTAQALPSATMTPTVMATATAMPAWAGLATVSAEVVNLRAGPSTDHGVVRQAARGETLPVFGRTVEGWLQVDETGGLWLFGELATLDVDAGAVPVVVGPTAVPVVATEVPAATATVGPVCDCWGDLYKCADFGSHTAAQACFEYCRSVVGYDVHRLDGDGDGLVCED